MDTARMYMTLFFKTESELISILEYIQKKLGDYDYFSMNIHCDRPVSSLSPYSEDISELDQMKYLKLLCFKKRVKWKDILRNSKRLSNLQKKSYRTKNLFFTFGFGYVTNEQVVGIYSLPSLSRVFVRPYLFCQIEMIYIGRSFSFQNTELPLKVQNQCITFFNDVRRLYFS